MEINTPERVALLGTATDAQIGKILEISARVVREERGQLGIPPFSQHFQPPSGQIVRLGTRPDHELASEWGCSPATVVSLRYARGVPAFQTQQAWTPAEVALLGTMSDAEVAQRVGRSKSAVAAMRRWHGVPGATLSLPHPHLEDIKRAYTTTMEPVERIAERYGVPREFVKSRAKKRAWLRPA